MNTTTDGCIDFRKLPPSHTERQRCRLGAVPRYGNVASFNRTTDPGPRTKVISHNNNNTLAREKRCWLRPSKREECFSRSCSVFPLARRLSHFALWIFVCVAQLPEPSRPLLCFIIYYLMANAFIKNNKSFVVR